MLADKVKEPDFAINNGKPLFDHPLHVGTPNIGNKQAILSKIEDILDRRMLSNGGPVVREFEQRIADYIGVKHCIAVTNGTTALEIAIRALDMKGEVIVPSMTFIATAHALQWQGITPVFCDIDENLHHIDTQKIESLIYTKHDGNTRGKFMGPPLLC